MSGRTSAPEQLHDQDIRVLVVDDHALVREMLAELLSQEAGLTVVGACEDGSQVVDAAARLRPDVIVMDLNMPVMDGLAATEALRALAPEPRVVVLTADGDGARPRAAAAGADALVPKSADPEELLTCVRCVALGQEPCPYCL
ncbi:response regulator [Geodermatophilus sp. URMC 64]